MKAEKILQYINDNDIDGLKWAAENEIYKKGTSVSEKKRLSAMNKFVKYAKTSTTERQQNLHRPYKIEFENETFYSFCNGYAMTYTREIPQGIEEYDGDKYINTNAIMREYKDYKHIGSIDFNKIMSKAKASGYKFGAKKLHNNGVFLKIDDTYLNLYLFDIMLSILNDGEKFEVYKIDEPTKGVYFKNEIGIAFILPVKMAKTMPETAIIIDGEID